jgi:hypothetical protein
MRHIKIKAPKGAKVMFQGTQDLIPDNVESEVVLTSYYRSRVLSGALVDVSGVIVPLNPVVENSNSAQKR